MIAQCAIKRGVQMCQKLNISDGLSTTEICDAGLRSYTEALETGAIGPEMVTECLLHLRLVEQGAEGEYIPVLPATATQLVLHPLKRDAIHRQEVIAAMESAFAAAGASYTRARQRNAADVRLIQGAETISAILQAAAEDCHTETLTVQPGGRRPPEILERALARDIAGLQRGLQQRTLYQHTIRTHEPSLEYIRRVTAAGAEVRTLDEVVDRLIIFDRRIAFMPTDAYRANEALEIRHPAIVRFLVGVFDKAWVRAHPIEATTDRIAKPAIVASETHLTIMRMIVNGYTHFKIARQLGMSLRTVTAHVGKISEQLGSSSPAQLGYLIATLGLLGNAEDTESWT